MTPEQIAAIAARNAARTPGKWQAVALGNDDYPSEVWFADNMRVCLMPSNTGQRKPKDAAFIAHASEDIPALLAEVARLTAELAEAEKRIAEAACNVVDAYSEFDRRYCCDGRMCGCQGQSVHDMMKHFIRAMVKS